MYKPRFNFQSAVYMILEREGKILFGRRCNSEWMNNMYMLPAGHLDGGETAQVALAREMKEELDIDIKIEDMQVVHTMHRKSSEREYFDIFIKVSKYSGVPKINEPDKCDDLSWFALNELPQNVTPHILDPLKFISEGVFYSNSGF